MEAYIIVQQFRSRILAACDAPCMATQDAVDQLAAEFGRGRAHFLETVDRINDSELCGLIGVAWAKAPLTRATGKTREGWLALFDRNFIEMTHTLTIPF